MAPFVCFRVADGGSETRELVINSRVWNAIQALAIDNGLSQNLERAITIRDGQRLLQTLEVALPCLDSPPSYGNREPSLLQAEPEARRQLDQFLTLLRTSTTLLITPRDYRPTREIR